MTLKELWDISPRCFVFVRQNDGSVKQYTGQKSGASALITDVCATKYPMYDHVLEVKLEEGAT